MDGRTYMHMSSGRRVRVSDQGAGSRERTLWSVFATERFLRTGWKLCSSSITAWVEMDGWMDGWSRRGLHRGRRTSDPQLQRDTGSGAAAATTRSATTPWTRLCIYQALGFR